MISELTVPVAMPDTVVDTGAELTWAPRPLLEGLGIRAEKHLRFQTADGRVIDRDVGYAIVHAAGVPCDASVVL